MSDEEMRLRLENARLQGQIEVLREYVPAPYEVRCPECRVLVATEFGENAVMARRDEVTFPCEPCSRSRWMQTVDRVAEAICTAEGDWPWQSLHNKLGEGCAKRDRYRRMAEAAMAVIG